MEENRKSDSDSLKRKHFMKLHEKIRNKYNAMKLKLDKSKSVGSLTSVSDEFDYKCEKFPSTYDVRGDDDVFEDKDIERPVIHGVIIEDASIKKHNAVLQEISFDTSSVFDNVSHSPDGGDFENYFLSETFMTSLDSLNDISGERIEEDNLSTTPTPKTSIRNRIGSRITAAKEKRNANKDKKRESLERVEKLYLSNSPNVVKKKQKLATMTIALIEAIGLENESTSEEKSRIFSCRFRLGTEKRKSKAVKSNSVNVSWQELFNLNMYDEQILEISLWDKDTLFGRKLIDMTTLEKEKTHKMWIYLDENAAKVQIFVLLTISGTTPDNTCIDDIEHQKSLSSLRRRFGFSKDVGRLSIIVYGAKGLCANECYCVLQLGNERLQTHTEYKTNDPNWMKIFTFAVEDVTSILELTVWDEKKSEEIGKISIPLLKINNKTKKWYALKDVLTQTDRAKGQNPRILLEMELAWNLLKASVRVIHPKEIKYLETDPKLDRQLLSRNWSRAKAVVNWTFDALKVIKTCFEWESRKWNVIALSIWLSFCWFFRMWMLPLLILTPFIWYRRQEYFLFNWKKYFTEDIPPEIVDEKEEKTTLRQKINSLQETVQTVQNTVGKFASFGERVKNLYNFSVPFLSFLTIFIISLISFIMFLIPVKYIFMLWGIHKFTRKILRPNRIPNSEILDLLSRVPDDDTLAHCEELTMQDITEEDKPVR